MNGFYEDIQIIFGKVCVGWVTEQRTSSVGLGNFAEIQIIFGTVCVGWVTKQTVTGSVFMRTFRLFLGQCVWDE